MNEPHLDNPLDNPLGNKIARLLDHGLGEIKQGTLYRLQQSRREAVTHYHAAGAVRNAGGTLAAHGHGSGHLNWHFKPAMLLPLIMLLALLVGLGYWHDHQQGEEMAEIDTLLLADDLPFDAYLDQDFDRWLEDTSR